MIVKYAEQIIIMFIIITQQYQFVFLCFCLTCGLPTLNTDWEIDYDNIRTNAYFRVKQEIDFVEET